MSPVWDEFPFFRADVQRNACVRRYDEPAPTMFFGGRLNKMVWEFQ